MNDLFRSVDALRSALAGHKLPPVQSWQPPRSGRIDIRIDREGSWYHEGTRIARKPLYRLFSTVLRRDGEDYYLVTPAEKLRIEVEDVPFVALAMDAEGSGPAQRLVFTTNCDDRVVCDAGHPLRVETDPGSGEPAPYVLVRDRLEARLARNVYYQLVDLAEARGDELGVWSADCYFVLGTTRD